QDYLSNLNDDCLYRIFSLLTRKDLNTMELMNSRMRAFSRLTHFKDVKLPLHQLVIVQTSAGHSLVVQRVSEDLTTDIVFDFEM
ncbi:hypothetical protein PFISCL1PPCAC_21936, partial [Pristionchus fissidentatus]